MKSALEIKITSFRLKGAKHFYHMYGCGAEQQEHPHAKIVYFWVKTNYGTGKVTRPHNSFFFATAKIQGKDEAGTGLFRSFYSGIFRIISLSEVTIRL